MAALSAPAPPFSRGFPNLAGTGPSMNSTLPADASAGTPSSSEGPPALPAGFLAQGAEGTVRRMEYLGRAAVSKERFAKRYRHPELDRRLTARRTNQEVRSLLRCSKLGLRVPGLYFVDAERHEVVLEFVRGPTLREFLKQTAAREEREAVARLAGRVVATMHDGGVIHGDLTTSNIIVEKSKEEPRLCLIDFGLSSQNGTEEDKAVDLYVLERAVISAHADEADAINEAFVQEYREVSKQGTTVLRRLAEVRMRGRKRDMVG